MQPFSALGSRGIFNHVKNYFVALFVRGHSAALSSLRFLSCPESACQSHTHTCHSCDWSALYWQVVWAELTLIQC